MSEETVYTCQLCAPAVAPDLKQFRGRQAFSDHLLVMHNVVWVDQWTAGWPRQQMTAEGAPLYLGLDHSIIDWGAVMEWTPQPQPVVLPSSEITWRTTPPDAFQRAMAQANREAAYRTLLANDPLAQDLMSALDRLDDARERVLRGLQELYTGQSSTVFSDDGQTSDVRRYNLDWYWVLTRDGRILDWPGDSFPHRPDARTIGFLPPEHGGQVSKNEQQLSDVTEERQTTVHSDENNGSQSSAVCPIRHPAGQCPYDPPHEELR